MDLNIFNHLDFLSALKAFFNDLKVPVNYIADEPADPQNILSSTYRDNEAFQLMNDVYFVGMVDDAAFDGKKSPDVSSIHSDYDGILIFGVTLKKRNNGLLPTRGQLAEISRAFNREYHFTPVVVIFKYDGQIAFANTERLKYKQGWREGEKAGKVSVLRDVNIQNPHRGHLEILKELEIPTSGKDTVDSFVTLYKYWQEVFSVSILNKKFYKELQTWYFWAIKEATFPNTPNRFDFETDEKFDEAVKEHKGKNVIRLLTRILFIWFIKEKGLIPEQLFDEKAIADKLIKDFTPQKPQGIFATGKHSSPYYRAILQNLFFATLNQEMGKRAFRIDGKNQNVTNLMRYKSYFKDPDYFVQLMENVVPFMNGGLFECLDKPHPTLKGKLGGDIVIYNDGFSDRDDNLLVVPDYLFFDVDEDIDVSDEFGSNDKVYKNAKTRGLLEILQSYKFTITENTPIEEDVALDPELLGKVFENLLASYNPETKTTARKQTGSFYTPREIVNYMVDESLIAYLKNTLKNVNTPEEQLEQDLHQLLSYDTTNPFQANPEIQKQIIKALDQCTILDPACGSGAFPMGILQKMVHVLHKIDPKNIEWEQRQIDRVNKAIESLEEIDDVRFREQSIKELKAQIKDIEDSFENNELDYGRKLYLIENCIYGVDIQSIATQISKLRFFISLIVDQKIDKTKENFGIRPLPNLETKFVAANTLIGIEKPKAQLNLFENQEIKKLEAELKKVRHKLFSSKSPANKRKLREDDKELRNRIADLLINDGWDNKTARQLASWDPYDQNESSPFFDKEWMFDISDGVDVVIGNPPYRSIQKYDPEQKKLWASQGYKVYANSGNIYFLFYELGLKITKQEGNVMYITSNQWLRNISGEPLRKLFLSHYCPELLVDFRGTNIFDNVAVLSNILMVSNRKCKKHLLACDVSTIQSGYEGLHQIVIENSILLKNLTKESWLIFDRKKHEQRELVIKLGKPISEWNLEIYRGILTGFNDAFYLNKEEKDNLIALDERNIEIIRPMLRGKDLARYTANFEEIWLIFTRRGIDIEKYPHIKNCLYKYYDDLKPKKDSKENKGRKPGAYKWYEIQDSINYYKKFDEPKMIFMNMSKDLIFSYDPKGEYLTNQKCFIVTGNYIRYLTAFFNSKLFGYFFKDNFPELLGDVREVSKVYFEKIPVLQPESKDTIMLIEELVEILVYAKIEGIKKLNSLQQIIEGIIIELYFSDHMKEREIDILKFVGKDFADVTQVSVFEKLSDTNKVQVIEQLHQTWSHPDNEVRNRMKLFAVRSPEILKPILES